MEEVVKFYLSHLVGDFKEVEEKGKRLNSSEYYASMEDTPENKKKFEL